MLGTIVNSLSIIFGGIIGLTLKKGLNANYKNTIMDGVSLTVIIIGIMSAIKTKNAVLLVLSVVIGGLIGERVSIEKKLDNLGDILESKIKTQNSGFSKGFVASTLVFCVGAMAIVGSLEAGIHQSYETLFAKSVLDGISSIIFASTMGIGVIFSAIPVFIYQGMITLLSKNLGLYLTPMVINEISAVGGVLIIGIGISLLGLKKIKVAHLLPAIFIPLLYYFIIGIF